MPAIITPIVMISFISTLLNAMVAFVAFTRRHQAGGWSLAGFMLSVTIWSGMATIQYSTTTLAANIFWAKMLYWGILQMPVWYLFFSFEFNGLQRWITWKNAALLCVIPVISLGLVWTNELHGLVWPSYTLMADGHSYLYTSGPVLLFLIAGYSYVLLGVGSYFLARTVLGLPSIFRKQIYLIICGISAPWIFNVIYLSGMGPFRIDPTPVVMSVSGFFFLLALFQYQLLDIAPVARHTVVDTLPDGVIVLDSVGRLADINPEAKKILGIKGSAVIGKKFSDQLINFPELEAVLGGIFPMTETATVLRDDAGSFLSVNFSPIFILPEKKARVFGGQIITLRDVTELMRTQEDLRKANTTLQQQLDVNEKLRSQLSEQAIHDPLTGLHNRRYLNEIFNYEIARAHRGMYGLSVFFIDIDNFKKVNDTFGHSVGDQVLIKLGQYLLANARAGDVVCRYGGEEFLMLMPGLEKEDILTRTQALSAGAHSLDVLGDGRELRITVSIGGAVYPHDGSTAEELIKAADNRQYEAKRMGRNRVVVG